MSCLSNIVRTNKLPFNEKLIERVVESGVLNGYEYIIAQNGSGLFYGYIIHLKETEQEIRRLLGDSQSYRLLPPITQPLAADCEDWWMCICLDIDTLEKSKQIMMEILEKI